MRRKKAKASAEANGIVTSDAVQGKHPRKRQVLWGVLICVVLLAAGSATWVVWHAKLSAPTAKQTATNPYDPAHLLDVAQSRAAAATSAAEKTATYSNLGNAYLNSGKTEQAIAAYRTAVKASNSNNLAALVGLANAYYKAGQRDNTITTYKKIVALLQEPNPSDPQVALDSGQVGWYQNAIQRLQSGGSL